MSSHPDQGRSSVPGRRAQHRTSTSPGGGPSIAVVVCAYTPLRTEQTLAALERAREQADHPGDEVLLVVDHHDELLAALADRVPAGVVVLANAEERGLSGARNTGWRAASAEVVAFLDDDALPRPGWVRALRERADDASVAVVGGAVHAAWEGGAAPAWFPPEYGWVVGCDYRGMPGDGADIRNPIGACMAVRRDVLEAVGGFSTELGRVGTLPVGCEETLLGIRVHQQLPTARSVRDLSFAVDHWVTADRQTVRYFVRRCFHEGRSKALVSRAVGAGDGLSSERSYVLRTLTSALVRNARSAVRGDAAAVARGGLVVAGLAVTALGLLSVSSSAREGAVVPAPLAGVDTSPVADDELVSVVVCTLGRDPRLVQTVAAVLGQTHPHLELVVVDNAPASGLTRGLLADVDDDRLRVVDQPVRGLSAARNAGLAAAKGRFTAFTDDDAVPADDWIEQLLAVLRADADGVVGGVTGRVLAAETATEEQAWFEEAGIFDKGTVQTTWSLVVPPTQELGVPGPRSVFFPYTAGEIGSGNNMVFRTDLLRSLDEGGRAGDGCGVFDEALGAGSLTKGGEDLDIFRRVVLAPSMIVYTPAAVVRHYHRDTYAALRDQMYSHGTGMASVLTKIVLGGGKPARVVLRTIPAGLHMLLSPTSTKNIKKPPAMPAALGRFELLGYLAGPALYLRSVAEARSRRAAGTAS